MKKILLLCLLLCSIRLSASDLKISTPMLYIEDGAAYSLFNVTWNNAWNNETNNDAVWIFFKSLHPNGGYRHATVSSEGHSVVSVFSEGNPNLKFEVPKDGTGLFLFPEKTFRGTIEATVKVLLDIESFEGLQTLGLLFRAYGIEMVRIPAGGFELGDPDEAVLKYGSFFKPGKDGNFDGLVAITSEQQELTIATDGDLYYQAPSGYEGDQTGHISASFPKGVDPFYIMKYEPTEGQYVDFLNSLSLSQLTDRIINKETYYAALGGSITEKEDGYYTTLFPDKPCLFMSWDDAMAYADWAGLRPMTEFEFTKAARGVGKPMANEFPWGSGNKDKMLRLPNSNNKLTMINNWDESKLSNETKAYFGASYYWVMDLAGSNWERLITIGHPAGRNFNGSTGDGTLTETGQANTETWPTGAEEAGGIGFRGGGFYGYTRSYHQYNPFSPIAYRPYGGWHGGLRNNSYGTRFVRSSK